MHPDAFRSMEDFFQEDGKINLYHPQQQIYKLVRTTFPFQINMIFEDSNKENSHWQKADSPISGKLYFPARMDLVQSDQNHTLPNYFIDQKFCGVHFWVLFFLLVNKTLTYRETCLGSFIKTNSGAIAMPKLSI